MRDELLEDLAGEWDVQYGGASTGMMLAISCDGDQWRDANFGMEGCFTESEVTLYDYSGPAGNFPRAVMPLINDGGTIDCQNGAVWQRVGFPELVLEDLGVPIHDIAGTWDIYDPLEPDALKTPGCNIVFTDRNRWTCTLTGISGTSTSEGVFTSWDKKKAMPLILDDQVLDCNNNYYWVRPGFDFSIKAVAAFKEEQLAAKAADLEPLFEKLRTWDNVSVGNNIVGITFKKVPLTPEEEVHTMSFTEDDDGTFSWTSTLYPHEAAGFYRTGDESKGVVYKIADNPMSDFIVTRWNGNDAAQIAGLAGIWCDERDWISESEHSVQRSSGPLQMIHTPSQRVKLEWRYMLDEKASLTDPDKEKLLLFFKSTAAHGGGYNFTNFQGYDGDGNELKMTDTPHYVAFSLPAGACPTEVHVSGQYDAYQQSSEEVADIRMIGGELNPQLDAEDREYYTLLKEEHASLAKPLDEHLKAAALEARQKMEALLVEHGIERVEGENDVDWVKRVMKFCSENTKYNSTGMLSGNTTHLHDRIKEAEERGDDAAVEDYKKGYHEWQLLDLYDGEGACKVLEDFFAAVLITGGVPATGIANLNMYEVGGHHDLEINPMTTPMAGGPKRMGFTSACAVRYWIDGTGWITFYAEGLPKSYEMGPGGSTATEADTTIFGPCPTCVLAFETVIPTNHMELELMAMELAGIFGCSFEELAAKPFIKTYDITNAFKTPLGRRAAMDKVVQSIQGHCGNTGLSLFDKQSATPQLGTNFANFEHLCDRSHEFLEKYGEKGFAGMVMSCPDALPHTYRADILPIVIDREY